MPPLMWLRLGSNIAFELFTFYSFNLEGEGKVSMN